MGRTGSAYRGCRAGSRGRQRAGGLTHNRPHAGAGRPHWLQTPVPFRAFLPLNSLNLSKDPTPPHPLIFIEDGLRFTTARFQSSPTLFRPGPIRATAGATATCVALKLSRLSPNLPSTVFPRSLSCQQTPPTPPSRTHKQHFKTNESVCSEMMGARAEESLIRREHAINSNAKFAARLSRATSGRAKKHLSLDLSQHFVFEALPLLCHWFLQAS